MAFALFVGFFVASSAWGEGPTLQAVSDAQSLSIEQVERAIAKTKESKDIDEATRSQMLDNFTAALNNLKSAAEHEAKEATLIAETQTVAARLEQLKKRRSELKDKQPAVDPKLTLAELEQLLPQTELQLSSQKKARQAAESELQLRAQRRKDIPARIVAIGERVTNTESQLQILASADADAGSASFATRLVTRRLTLVKELPALEAELAKYDAEESADLIRSKIDLANAEIGYTEKTIASLQARINEARELAAEESVRKARYEAIAAAPALQAYAEQNQELAEKAKRVTEDLAAAQRDLKSAVEVHEALVNQFRVTRNKVDLVGLTSSVGTLLRKQRTSLPDVSERREAVAMRQPLINDIQYELLEYEDLRSEVAEPQKLLATIVEDSGSIGSLDQALLESAAQELLSRKGEYLDTLIRNSSQYFHAMIELDLTDQQIIKQAAEYENYIDERVLWIRSGRSLLSGLQFNPSDAWLISPKKWSEVGTALVVDIQKRMGLYLICLIPIALLFFKRRSIRSRIRSLGETTERANCKSITPTIQTIFLTNLVSLEWSALLGFFGWRLFENPLQSEFASAIGSGLLCVSLLWFATEILRQACRPMGLGESHFGWSEHSTRTLRRGLRTFATFAFPLTMVTTTLACCESSHGRDSLERIFFVLGMLTASVVLFRLLMPGGLLRSYLASNPRGWVDRFKYVWGLLGICVPMALAGLAIAGFYYTAQILFWRLFATWAFIATVYMLRAFCFRMLLLRRRYLSMEQLRQRAAAAAATTPSTDEHTLQSVSGITTEDPKADISAQSQQAQRLITTGLFSASMVGLWLIWVGVLPALSMLDNYCVWGGTATGYAAHVPSLSASPMSMTPDRDSQESEDEKSPDRLDREQMVSNVVTISDLALAILIVIVCFVLFRNGPGLLEMSVLQQLPLDASVRYAITTLVSYAIVLVGTIAACSTIGLQWSQIQWLATALTFGLAFGLQEIFANFVAGLIILIERPIRVGDIVTVDEVTGVVSRIRIRATSITNWDRKEYVVPNKEFITGRLLNWTLSDKVNRIVIEVGVAYGSDTERARQILLQTANSHPLTLDDPASVATFEGFGDSTLKMVLKTYLASFDHRVETIHQLHTEINKAFQAEGIEIAFPQCDLHVRSFPMAQDVALRSEQIVEAQEVERAQEVEQAREAA
ncbi:Miniconductance mechanosensitive channel MscM precursor [Novipirellula aureliae]|uniref:Miniconductance mechanosensitive channel MscM n=1 Tax=Novipirellula aureliae TaxID=2527966 RepID=A0A5C6DYT3_9BACT|nr:Miniconductance mechanosensitive channel MscM precursor [Novipirellula aureliae]